MSTLPNKLSPELRELLEEFSSAPSAHILRARPGRTLNILYPESRRGSPRSALPKNAERHLLQAHRDEVGRLLYTQAAIELTRDTAFGSALSASVTLHQTLELPDAATLKRRSATAAAGLAARDSDPGAEVLARCCSTGARLQPADLLEASMRVRPSDSARVSLGLDLMRRGQLQAAEDCLHQVLAGHPTALIRSYSWQNLGLLENRRGQHAQAADAYQQAAEAHEDRIAPLLSLFGEYLHLGQREDALETSRRIDDMVGPEHDAVRSYIQGRGNSRRSGEWSPTPSAQDLLPRIIDRLGAASNEIARLVFA